MEYHYALSDIIVSYRVLLSSTGYHCVLLDTIAFIRYLFTIWILLHSTEYYCVILNPKEEITFWCDRYSSHQWQIIKKLIVLFDIVRTPHRRDIINKFNTWTILVIWLNKFYLFSYREYLSNLQYKRRDKIVWPSIWRTR